MRKSIKQIERICKKMQYCFSPLASSWRLMNSGSAEHLLFAAENQCFWCRLQYNILLPEKTTPKKWASLTAHRVCENLSKHEFIKIQHAHVIGFPSGTLFIANVTFTYTKCNKRNNTFSSTKARGENITVITWKHPFFEGRIVGHASIIPIKTAF